jgi:adenosine kinase
VIPYTDYLIGNETEALSYAEHHGWGTTDIVEIAKKLATLPKKNGSRPRVATITQGTLPTITAVAKENGEVEVNEYEVHEVPKEKINDTNGAGYVLYPRHFVGIMDLANHI